ncbi:MAG TPA: class I SAM-dependent methyltransferase [Solirubrobacter sp.]
MARTGTLDQQGIEASIAALDVGLFRAVSSQTKKGDRASLLALQGACAERFGTFDYLEIGSHLGGSLQAFVRDARVTGIVSIDLRPEATPDERGKDIPYIGNSTQRMLDNLAALPEGDTAKIHTIDADTRTLTPADVSLRPQLCFIDGEHTNESCLADARFCRSVLADRGVIAFHDTGLIFPAINAFLAELRADGLKPIAYPLPDVVFAIELGGPEIYRTRAMRTLVTGERNQLPPLAALLARRPAGPALTSRQLERYWLSGLGSGRRLLDRRMSKLFKSRRRRLAKSARRRVRRARKRVPFV